MAARLADTPREYFGKTPAEIGYTVVRMKGRNLFAGRVVFVIVLTCGLRVCADFTEADARHVATRLMMGSRHSTRYDRWQLA